MKYTDKDGTVKEYSGTSFIKKPSVSKVVDENGEPLIVYHGSKSNFNTFITKRLTRTEKRYLNEEDVENEAFKSFTEDEIKIIKNIDNDPFSVIEDPFAPPSENNILYNKFLSEKKKIRDASVKEIAHYEIGSYFTTDYNYANSYGHVNYPVFLNIKNPNFSDHIHRLYSSDIAVATLKKEGFDGIYGHDVKGRDIESSGIEYQIFNPN